MQVTLFIDKSLEENAGIYFDKAKKAKSKLEGAQEALQESQHKLKKLEKQAAVEEEVAQKATQIVAKKWYHKFRWFITSDGFLAVGGRDATTNDIIVKKHVEVNDLVFHTEMPGSPFFILKAKSEVKDLAADEFPLQSKQEVANATATFSKAWTRQLGSTEVYCIKPDQVKKELGLPKGTFMIYGKREYFNPVLDLCIGVMATGEVMAGPESAIQVHCTDYYIITHGTKKVSAIAKQFVKQYGGELDTVIRTFPGGEFKIVKIVKSEGAQ